MPVTVTFQRSTTAYHPDTWALAGPHVPRWLCRDGRQGLLIEPGRTGLVADLEAVTSPWTMPSALATATTTTKRLLGAAAVRIEATRAGGGALLQDYALWADLAPGASAWPADRAHWSLQVGAWVRGRPGAPVAVRAVRAIDGQLRYDDPAHDRRTTVRATGDWQLVAVGLAPHTGTGMVTGLHVRIGLEAGQGVSVGDWVVVDAPVIEVCYPAALAGVCAPSWSPAIAASGAPMARHDDAVVIGDAVLPADSGTLALRLWVPPLSTPYLWAPRDGSAGLTYVLRCADQPDGSIGAVRLIYRDGSRWHLGYLSVMGQQLTEHAVQWVAQPAGWVALVGTWSPDGLLRLYVDGRLVGQTTYTPRPQPLMGAWSLTPGAYGAPLVVQDVRLAARAWTEAEVRAWAAGDIARGPTPALILGDLPVRVRSAEIDRRLGLVRTLAGQVRATGPAWTDWVVEAIAYDRGEVDALLGLARSGVVLARGEIVGTPAGDELVRVAVDGQVAAPAYRAVRVEPESVTTDRQGLTVLRLRLLEVAA